ncbi:MAG: hypothetical protein MJ116_02900 [Lachnospiraceae bacterium]|nr:hypothetical protein [Lachnospiraceae bacterium]
MIIEEIVRNHLEAKLTVPVKVKKDESCPEYVLLEKTGGGKENLIFSASITVQSYGKNLYDAALLNEEVKQAMDKLTEVDQVTRCDLNSDYHFPDPDIKAERYQAVFNIRHY